MFPIELVELVLIFMDFMSMLVCVKTLVNDIGFMRTGQLVQAKVQLKIDKNIKIIHNI